MCAFPMIFASAAAFPKASLAFGPLHGFAEELVHKNMHVELSRTAYAYCQCRNVERAWSTPPRICATFRGLPRQAPPRVTISILTYLQSTESRLRETVCHYAAMAGIVDVILVQWNNNAVRPPPLGNCTDIAEVNGIAVKIRTFAHNTLLNRYTTTDDMGPLAMLQDDDVRYSWQALRSFAVVAALFPESIVGVNGRMAVAYERPEATANYFHPDKEPGRYLNDSHYRLDASSLQIHRRTAPETDSIEALEGARSATPRIRLLGHQN